MCKGPVDPGYGVSAPPGACQLPVFPFDPTIDNSLPSGGARPDNTLPGAPPQASQLPSGGGGNYPSFQPIVPGARFMVKYIMCIGLCLVPDNSLPSGGSGAPRPDNTLPGGPPPLPGQGLPPTAQPKK